MRLIAAVEEAERAFRARGETFRRLEPPSPDELIRIDQDRDARPESLRALLTATRGIDLGIRGRISFSGEPGNTGYVDLFPGVLSLGNDDFGNEMVVELSPAEDRCGPVFYICHDPPVAVIHSMNLSDFILSLATEDWGKEHCLPSQAIRDAVDRIWAHDPFSVPARDFSRHPGDIPVEFLEALGPNGRVTDLRQGEIGEGFSFGRFGAYAGEFRVADRLVFGIAPPPDSWLVRTWKSVIGGR